MILDQLACTTFLLTIMSRKPIHQISSSSSSSSSLYHRKPLLVTRRSSTCCSSFCETAGSTTAECAAVICCFPCGLFNFLIFVVYRIPAGLCKRALRKRRREKLIKNGNLMPKRRKCQCGCDETEVQIHHAKDVGFVKTVEVDKEVLKLEMEMWERFYGTGFWRSPSQREINHVVVDS